MARKLWVLLIMLALGLLSILILSSVAPSEVPGQALFLFAAAGLYLAIQYPLPELYGRIAPLCFAATFLGLMATLFLGKISHGAMRWIPLGPIHIQVSELAKPLLSLMLALYATRYPLVNQRRILGFMVLAGLYLIPVFLQPDLGSALVLAASTAAIVFIATKKLILLLPWIALAIVGSVFLWQFVLYPYQKDRLFSFVSNDPATSYNARQALITVGSGKILGRGLGHGVQSTLRFLPEFHTDFFFATYAEELGLVGVGILFLLYFLLFVSLVQLPKRVTPFGYICSVGIIAGLFFQMAVHIGMNMRLFPITGIPLPLLSSGGSSFLSTGISLGLVLRAQDGV